MGKMLIVNGSPRAPRSNSKQYAALFEQYWGEKVDLYCAIEGKHAEICQKLGDYAHVLLVFPLYVDGIPVPLLHFLKEWQNYPADQGPVVHTLVNCGFLEPEQNAVAVEQIRLFCRLTHRTCGVTLCIGSGEAILATPFAFLVKRKIQKMTQLIRKGRTGALKVTMPLTKKMFLQASTQYWTRSGAQKGTTPEQMATMEIEGADG